MSEEKARCITVLLKCTGCDNEVCLTSPQSSGEGYIPVSLGVRNICMKCGVDMKVVVERTTHTATTEEVTRKNY